jgi:hypothetical protein
VAGHAGPPGTDRPRDRVIAVVARVIAVNGGP